MPSLADDAAAAKRVLRAALKRALAEQEELARRALLDGGAGMNRAFIAQTRRELRALAEENAITIVGGKYGDLLEAEFARGVKAAGGVSSRIDPQIIQMALSNSEVLVNDILDESIAVINAEMVKVSLGTSSLREAADAIRDKVRLSTDGEISPARADLIAGSEYKSIGRQAQMAAGIAEGDKWWRYSGPDDNRTSDICSELMALGVMTLDEWQEEIESRGMDWEIFKKYGGHHGCRGHQLVPAEEPV